MFWHKLTNPVAKEATQDWAGGMVFLQGSFAYLIFLIFIKIINEHNLKIRDPQAFF